jgi:hypothetical protein
MSATRGRRPTRVLLAALGSLLALVGIELTVTLALGRHSHPSPAPTSASAPQRLDHASVEQQIANWGYTGVVCNHGDDLQIIMYAQYTCLADGNQQIRVTITAASGNYVWGLTG